jgi:superfamily II DNA or RNA helicase
MATGSGKSIVMIKLIEMLKKMSEKGVIPANDILILAPTDKILEQSKVKV